VAEAGFLGEKRHRGCDDVLYNAIELCQRTDARLIGVTSVPMASPPSPGIAHAGVSTAEQFQASGAEQYQASVADGG